MDCAICHQKKDETDFIRCPLCHQHACEECRYTRHGRHFCSRYCGEAFFFSEDEDED